MNKPSTSIPYVLPFQSLGKKDLPVVGGKGANLGEMSQAGFPVPPGFCVTVPAFQLFIASSNKSNEIFSTLDEISANDIENARRVGQWVREQLTAVPIPDEITQAILLNWKELGSDHAYAVRSSATAEDLPEASFAGQQDTFLNIRDQTSLMDSIKKCWISLFTDRAILYRIQNGFSHKEVFLSVVVQRMVLPEVSGIMFTADPVTGCRHITSIDASFGLGEALVAGLVSADLYKVDKQKSAIVEKIIAEKKLAIWPLPEGGTRQEPLTDEKQTANSLSDQQAIDLAAVGAKIEAHYGAPQDIEWAIKDGQIVILQSRPITSLFPIPENALKMAEKTRELQVMFSFGAVQGMLGPMTRLGQDAIRLVFAGATVMFGYQGITCQSQQVIWSGAERLWGNTTAIARHPIGRKVMTAALSAIEPSVVQAMKTLWQDPRMAFHQRWFKFKTVVRILRFFLPMIGRVFLVLRNPVKHRENFQNFLEKNFRELHSQSLVATNLTDRIDLFEKWTRSGFTIVLPPFLPVMASAMSMLNLMIKLAKQLPHDTFNPLIVTRGLPHNVTTEMDLELWHTAKTIQVDSIALAEFQKNTTSTLAEAYLARQLHPTSQEAINQFFDKYGMRGVGEIDIGQPRWREEPAHIIQVLQSYLQIDDENKAPDKLFAQGAEKADLEKIAIVEALRKTHGGRLKARLFNFAASRMRALAGLRESPKFFIIRMMGIVRKSLLESGRELVEEGVLSQPDDLFFLDLAELKRLAAGDNEDWKTLVSQRRRVHQREKQRTQIPRLLLSDGYAFYEGMAPYDGEASKSAVVDDYHMVGSPVSPGVVEGRAHIIFDPASEMLSPGEILVCPGTDPAWTPLFLAAGGLVMEVGGLMTHGSVVAREYGIPAVVGVHKATTALKTGQLIRVDGTAGIITILNSDGE